MSWQLPGCVDHHLLRCGNVAPASSQSFSWLYKFLFWLLLLLLAGVSAGAMLLLLLMLLECWRNTWQRSSTRSSWCTMTSQAINLCCISRRIGISPLTRYLREFGLIWCWISNVLLYNALMPIRLICIFVCYTNDQ